MHPSGLFLAYYYGDKAPNFFPEFHDVPEKPGLDGLNPGYDFDIINTDVLKRAEKEVLFIEKENINGDDLNETKDKNEFKEYYHTNVLDPIDLIDGISLIETVDEATGIASKFVLDSCFDVVRSSMKKNSSKFSGL